MAKSTLNMPIYWEDKTNNDAIFVQTFVFIILDSYLHVYFEGIVQKGTYPPCLRMADRALFAGYLRLKPISLSCTHFMLRCALLSFCRNDCFQTSPVSIHGIWRLSLCHKISWEGYHPKYAHNQSKYNKTMCIWWDNSCAYPGAPFTNMV